MSKHSTITTVHEGQMRCTTQFGPSEALFSTDIDTDLGGLGVFPRPGEMLAASVASCMMSMIVYKAKGRGLGLEGIAIASSYHAGEHGIEKLCFDIRVPERISDADRRVLEAAAKACPVGNALRPEIEKCITWRWADDPV